MLMMKTRALLVFVALMVWMVPLSAWAHCEVPCGIYDDSMRLEMMGEDILTIEKSMKQIQTLEKKSSINYNQLIRWVVNKEQHAQKIQDVVARYFLAQRIRPDTPHYRDKLVVLHQVLIAAMKCKQTTDLSHVRTLKELLARFRKLYLGEKHTH